MSRTIRNQPGQLTWLGRPLLRVGYSLLYIRDLRRTPAQELAGLYRLRWWKLPLCWIRGHHYGRRGYVEISCCRLEFCRCCGQEIVGRTRWSDIEPRPIDDDLPWDWCDDEGDDR